jgi:hypothetical protein
LAEEDPAVVEQADNKRAREKGVCHRESASGREAISGKGGIRSYRNSQLTTHYSLLKADRCMLSPEIDCRQKCWNELRSKTGFPLES